MARLITNGFECQKVATTPARDFEGQSCWQLSGTLAINTVTPRGGAACLVAPAAGAVLEGDFTGVSGRDYWLRTAVRFPAITPSDPIVVMGVGIGGSPAHGVRLNTDNTFQLVDNAALGAVGAKSAVISANTWYVVEMHFITTTGGIDTLGLRVDGATVQSDLTTLFTGGVANSVVVGKLNTSDATLTVRLDDLALNDSTGLVNTSWPGLGKVALLKPISDNARVGFTAGAGATTNLFAAEDNTPPVGVVAGSATDASQIKSANNNNTDHYDANLAAYTTAVASGGAGMASTDQVVFTYALSRGGNSSTTSRTMAVECLSNPTHAEVTGATGTTIIGTDNQAAPVGWTTIKTPISVVAPTLGTSPVVKVRKGTASTDGMHYDLMGLMVEWKFIHSPTLTPVTETDAAQAVDTDKKATSVNAAESDAAQALTFTKTIFVTIVPVSEADSAQPLSATKTIFKALTAATEADAAQGLSAHKRATTAAASEADTAQALSITQPIVKSLTAASESDTAQGLTEHKRAALSSASESDSAQALSFTKAIVKALAPAIETDTAQALSVQQPILKTLTPASESDTSFPLDADKRMSLGVASEADTSQALDRDKRASLAWASESDVAQALTFSKPIFKTVGVASESDAAQVLAHLKRLSIGVASESDTAPVLGLTFAHVITLGVVAESDSAQRLLVGELWLPSTDERWLVDAEGNWAPLASGRWVPATDDRWPVLAEGEWALSADQRWLVSADGRWVLVAGDRWAPDDDSKWLVTTEDRW